MKNKSFLGWLIIMAMSLLFGWLGYKLGSQFGQDGTWLALLLAFLSMGFFVEASRDLIGERALWNSLSTRDKLVFTVSVITLSVFCLYPIKEGQNTLFRGISFLLGGLVAWIIISVFATEKGKERLLPFRSRKE
jgi:hypothetical protein